MCRFQRAARPTTRRDTSQKEKRYRTDDVLPRGRSTWCLTPHTHTVVLSRVWKGACRGDMRVLMKTLRRVATARLHKDAPSHQGTLHFELQLWDPGETSTIWEGGRAPSTVAEWLQQATSDGRIVVIPPPIILDLGPVEVNAAQLRELPSDALVNMEWHWRRLKGM